MLRVQGALPLNPQGMTGLTPDLSFNTAVSFITNTNWQNYGGETTMSYLVQMFGLTHQNFLSAATGIVLAMVLIRGFARASTHNLGNFWVDITRCTLYILSRFAFPTRSSSFGRASHKRSAPTSTQPTLEGAKQTIAVGPVASQIAIKMLGTNAAASSTSTPPTRLKTRRRCRTSSR